MSFCSYNPYSVFVFVQSSLKDVSPSEEFQCSLGVDPSIRLTIVPVKTVRGQTGLITKHVSMGYKHVFEVKNTKQQQVKVVLSEQLPLSTDERIKVRVLIKHALLQSYSETILTTYIYNTYINT